MHEPLGKGLIELILFEYINIYYMYACDIRSELEWKLHIVFCSFYYVGQRLTNSHNLKR